MSIKEWYYTYICGLRENTKLVFFVRSGLMLTVPKWWCSIRLKKIKKTFAVLPQDEQQAIQNRVDYYCKVNQKEELPNSYRTLIEHTYKNKVGGSAYFFDSYEYTRFFPGYLRWTMKAGDVREVFPVLTVAKTRPIEGGENTTLMKLNKVRHFNFIHDPFSWEEKKDSAIFRGSCYGKLNRQQLVEMFADDTTLDVRDCCNNSINPEKWQVKKPTSMYRQLQYKFILALEGNEIASNLKWIMSSNSIAVSCKMRYESWFMEGRLKPDYHYIEVADDYHDMKEKLHYYATHPDEAKAIIQHAHEWVEQFKDKKIEEMVGALTMEKYLKMVN